MTPQPLPFIKPTIGRRVWLWPNGVTSINGATPAVLHTQQPFDAGISFVWGDAMLNLSYADHYGVMHNAASVPLLQAGDPVPPHGFYATWMPFQKGQATAQDRAAQPPATDAFVAPGASLFSDPSQLQPAPAMRTAFESLEYRSAEFRATLGAGGLVTEEHLRTAAAIVYDFTTTMYATPGEFVEKYLNDMVEANKDFDLLADQSGDRSKHGTQATARNTIDWFATFAGVGQAIHNAYVFVPPGSDSHEQQLMRASNEAQTRRLADELEGTAQAGG